MSRRTAAPVRHILPDPKFNNDMLAKFMNVVMQSGKKAAAALVRQGQMKLLGKTDLGDYSIDLQKVRTITPIR